MEYRNKHIQRGILKSLQTTHRTIKYINYPEANTIMELGAGKLNDLDNWIKKGIKTVYAVEVDADSIKLGTKKYNDYKTKYNKKCPEVIYIKADLSKPEYIDKMIKTLTNLKGKMEHIICNFAIHYFLKDSESFAAIVKLIKYFLMLGGSFRFCTMDGRTIYNKLSLLDTKILGSNDSTDIETKLSHIEIKLKDIVHDYNRDKVVDIEKAYNGVELVLSKNNKTYFKIKRMYSQNQELLDYGQKISVYVISIGNPHMEYLVNFDYIIKVLKKNGFILNEYKPFSEYIYDMKNNIHMSFVEYKWSIMNTYLEFKSII
jgi:hypothetical protein